MFQNFFEAKSNKLSCSKTFQKQRGTNRGIPKFSEAKRNKKKNSKALFGTKRNKWICSKNLQIKGKQIGSIVKKQQKNREKTKVRFSFGTKARSKGFDQKKTRF